MRLNYRGLSIAACLMSASSAFAGSVSGIPVAPVLVPVMLASRLVLGVHYPSDVVAGAGVGAGCAALTRAAWPSDTVQRLLPAALRDDAPGTRTLDSHVKSLRAKIGAARVRTVHGVGYALEDG